jgi:arsenate reductase-like glutaredoxin family protein
MAMSGIQWSYHRSGCKTCGKTRSYLETHKLEPAEIVDARKVRLKLPEALDLTRQADELYATRGRRVVHVDLRQERPTDDELSKLLIGPSGNLRAPSLLCGKTLIVGFDQAMYDKLFASGSGQQRSK